MPGVSNLSLVEGAFEELASELATYLDNIKGEGSTVSSDITPLLVEPEKIEQGQQTDKDAVLKKLVTASSVLNNAPERELQAAYNLLIHLISQASEPESTGIALGVLGTLFNTIQPEDDTRFHVLLAIVEVIKKSGNYETLRPQLRTLDSWVQQWELDAEDQRQLYLAVSNAASTAKESEDSYAYLLRALRTLQDDSSSTEARDLSLKALKTAVQNEKHFDFQDLTALDSIQSLRKSDQIWSELLELFSSESYEDLQDFKEANSTFLSDNGLNEEILDRKMRLLTLASLSVQASQTRTLPYSTIAKALNIPSEDVEIWVIDTIRSGLVEGKLSQQNQEFLIHRSTYRVFGENQWREVASRLETWKSSLVNVLAVIRSQKEEFIREKEAEISGGGIQGGQGYRPDRRQRNAPSALEVE
ncbi:hypothetical protein LTR37_005126 [Vermiconidia calcicola]|uniref:Uncharacterized protein n=1 Tax=Vermiconidia calcicola TaxID=1690605 RepID=A0ACC3NK57_9PEZI|nr:hypothetical protein LTR37_005126 [Vermiconidia calcicola]